MTFTLRDDTTAVDTDDGMVLLDENSGRYWQLNVTGATIVRCLLAGGTERDAAIRLGQRFPSSADRVPTDVADLVRALRDADLIRCT